MLEVHNSWKASWRIRIRWVHLQTDPEERQSGSAVRFQVASGRRSGWWPVSVKNWGCPGVPVAHWSRLEPRRWKWYTDASEFPATNITVSRLGWRGTHPVFRVELCLWFMDSLTVQPEIPHHSETVILEAPQWRAESLPQTFHYFKCVSFTAVFHSHNNILIKLEAIQAALKYVMRLSEGHWINIKGLLDLTYNPSPNPLIPNDSI